MGYYLDLIIESGGDNNYQTVMGMLLEAGLQIVPYEKTDEQYRDISLLHPDMPFPISIIRNKTDSTRARRIDIRLSWGLDSDDLGEYLKSILKLGNNIGCKVYDGQVHEYVTYNNIDKIVSFYLLGASQVKDLFGFAETADKKAENKKYLPVAQEINPNDAIYYKNVEDLDLSIRSLNCLKKAHIYYVGELVQKTYEELRAMPNIGKRSTDQIREVLADMGLDLGTKLDKWSKDEAENLIAIISDPPIR